MGFAVIETQSQLGGSPLKFFEKTAWQATDSVLYYSMINEDNETELLLNAICEGVEVPTDEEAEQAKIAQQGDSLIL